MWSPCEGRHKACPYRQTPVRQGSGGTLYAEQAPLWHGPAPPKDENRRGLILSALSGWQYRWGECRKTAQLSSASK